jgi:hypothetical protein
MRWTGHVAQSAARRVVAAVVAGIVALAVPGGAEHREGPCLGAPPATEYIDREMARAVHVPSIDCVIYRGIVLGRADDQGQWIFDPRSEVTRGQMASFVAQALDSTGIALPDPLRDERFVDTAGSVHRWNIERLAEAGIVAGRGGDRFEPSTPVTRAQMASFVVRATRFALGGDAVRGDGVDQFGDVPDDDVHKDAIEAGADTDPRAPRAAVLFRGVSPGRFDPTTAVRRDQMATFVRAFFEPIYWEHMERWPFALLDTEVIPVGQPIIGQSRSPGVATVRITGPCVRGSTVTRDEAGVLRFSVDVEVDFLGECSVQFGVTFTDGGTDQEWVDVLIVPAS